MLESEAKSLVEKRYLCQHMINAKASHVFNVLDARGAISVAEAEYIGRIREITNQQQQFDQLANIKCQNFLELFSEEIPASLQKSLEKDFRRF